MKIQKNKKICRSYQRKGIVHFNFFFFFLSQFLNKKKKIEIFFYPRKKTFFFDMKSKYPIFFSSFCFFILDHHSNQLNYQQILSKFFPSKKISKRDLEDESSPDNRE